MTTLDLNDQGLEREVLVGRFAEQGKEKGNARQSKLTPQPRDGELETIFRQSLQAVKELEEPEERHLDLDVGQGEIEVWQ